MKLSADQSEQLLMKARNVYIEELKTSIEKMERILEESSNGLPAEESQYIFRFFHSMGGTAATLGMDNLAGIGRETEARVKLLLDRKEGLKDHEAAFVRSIIQKVKQELKIFVPKVKKIDGDMGKDSLEEASLGRILLIDDDNVILNLLETAFSMEGYTVYLCDNSVEAMDAVAVSKPDIILLDIMMPQYDGYEILARIKEHPFYSDTCVIFLSAVDDMDSKIKAMRAGIDDYITKPFDIQEVVTRVEMILRRANKFREKLLKDELTGAYSRHSFNERIKAEMEGYKRNHTLFSVAFLDIDFFKEVNDTYGHTTGDFVLRSFVGFLKDNLRQCDAVFRYGGEEFVVLMPDTDEQEAFTAIDRIREEFSMQPIHFARNTLHITFSGGIKQVTPEDTGEIQIVSKADEAMYKAKQSGRNRIGKYSEMDEFSLRKKTLLLVDDENSIVRLLEDRLNGAGYNVVVTENGRKAKEMVTQLHFDGVVLDLILPDMDGLDICRNIKENRLTRKTKVIILSQKRKEEDIVKGFEAGADDYVVKPFSMAELEARIKRVVSQ